MHLQYDGVDWVARLVRFLVDLVQDDLSFTTAGSSVTDWAELLAVRPRTYLRLSLAMDLSMSSGRFPDKKDFLARLDGLRLGRTARPPRCSPAETGQTSRALEADGDSPLALDVSGLASNGGAAGAPEKVLENASLTDGLEGSDQPQHQAFDGDADLDRFTCLPDDLDDFFDPGLGDLAAGGEPSTNKTYDADIDTLLLASQEMMQT